MEVMEENEAIIIQGFEQFSAVEGYAASLKYVGDHKDKAEVIYNVFQRFKLYMNY
jgi:hypothetical protein